MSKLRFVVAVSLLVIAKPAMAPAQTPDSTDPSPDGSLCLMIQSVAKTNLLPVDFFARLIWKESRFHPDEVGPLTYTGEHAQGIAQFMPGTAAERGLFEPFNPAAALPKSGELLAELRAQFGNRGLAAAAYNAGPQRVRDFLAGSHDLPPETRNYVLAITGHSVEEWKNTTEIEPSKVLESGQRAGLDDDAMASCREITAFLKQEPNLFGDDVQQQRWVPSWCRYLHHPNLSECGSVHEERSLISGSSFNSRSPLHVNGHHHADTFSPLHVNASQ
jgi:Transglycosylase SLT domain